MNRSPIPWFYRRLVVSTSLLVLLVAVATAAASLGIFRGLYEDQLAELHRVSVANLADSLRRSVTEPGLSASVEVAVQLLTPSSSFFGVDDQQPGNSVKIQQTAGFLADLLTRNAATVRAIGIDYPRARLSVSTDGGLDWRGGSPPAAAAWLGALVGRGSGAWWRSTPEVPLVFYRTFPPTSRPEEASAVIAVEFRPEVVQGLLTSYADLEGGRISLVDTEGRQAFIAGQPTGPQALASRLVLDDLGWTLVDEAPLARLYQKTEPVLAFIGIVTLVVLAGGLGLSVVLASRLYAPLGRLLGRVRGQFGQFLPAAPGPSNEYALLGAALEGLSASLETSRPIIRDEGIRRLLDPQTDPQRAAEALVLVDLPAWPPVVRTLVTRWSPPSEDPGPRMLPYALAEALGRFLPGVVLPTVLDGRTLGAVVGPSSLDGLAPWAAWAHDTWGCTLRSALGPAVTRADEVPASFAAARSLAAWLDFHPGVPVLADRPDLVVRESSGAPVPEGLFDSWDQGLRLRKVDAIGSALAAVRREVFHGGASSRTCRQALDRLGGQAAAWARDLGVPVNLPEVGGDVPAFLDRLETVCVEALERWEGGRLDRAQAVVRRVRALVRDHLGAEVSLDRAAEAVGLSPGYLSSLFKETAGIPFVAFVTETRLDEARRLLETTDETVKAVGQRVGYQTPGYFIHQFKAKYGLTPVEFRRRSVRNG